ncbi:GNAT family N-acetyltransferase [Methylomonas sp. CM2]|uniref:GNAT family N-acetyltransferase n=1 Tax=Methylomonas sp. CM2 TaxID=3417647 RepID=UPI003CF68D7D
MDVTPLDDLDRIDRAVWNELTGDGYPFLRHEFLAALEHSGSVSPRGGWWPQHLLALENGRPVGLLPLYRKSHSWGEYVFDQQWADAYRQHGLAYYPKWLTAIPFTPCQGPRWAVAPGTSSDAVLASWFEYLQDRAKREAISSWHCLFPRPDEAETLRALGMSIREGVQFQWFNREYRDFADFLDTMTAAKRKMVKRERRKVEEQGIVMQRVAGADVTDEQWQAFYRFYAATYIKHHSQPYLNLDFFREIALTMPQRILLILAINGDRYVGAALSLIGADTLYGRYWGCDEEFSGLHFEACYYQGIDYCIANGLSRFDSGAQGEHKIARGFEPITTYSAHWLRDPGFADAVERFLEREKIGMQRYKLTAQGYLPFKHAGPDRQ